jgi:hypothetical protein
MRVFRSFEPMRLALKVHGRPDDYRKGIVQAVAEVAPDQPIAHVRPMNDVIFNDILSPSYFNLWLVGLFAVLALLLAAVGMYSVMAVAVAAREPEFGVRTALGASPVRLVRLVLRGALRQIMLGLLLGVSRASALLRIVIEHRDAPQCRDPFSARQLLPGDLQPQCIAMGRHPDPAEQLFRRIGTGEARPLAGQMFGVALFGIARDPCVDPTISALDQVDRPGIDARRSRIIHAFTPTRSGPRLHKPASTTGATSSAWPGQPVGASRWPDAACCVTTASASAHTGRPR